MRFNKKLPFLINRQKANGRIVLDSTGKLQASSTLNVDSGINANSLLQFRVAGVEKIRIQQNGYTGINTTSPLYMFDVNGSVGFADYIYHRGDNDTHIFFNTDLILFKAGNIELIRAYEDAGRGYVTINENSASVDFRIESDANTHAFFLNGANGKVGIGTNNPIHALDVVGGIQCTLDVRTGGGLFNTSQATLFWPESNLGWTARSGNTGQARIILKSSTNTRHGSIMGSGNAIGMLDASDRWAMLHDNGNFTRFYDNNELMFHIGQGHNGDFGSVSTYGNGEGNWEGYSINGQWVFMAPDANRCSIYSDQYNEFAIDIIANNAVTLFYNGQAKLLTTADGIRVQSDIPRLYLTDTNSNPDWSLINANGIFRIWNDTSNAIGLQIDGNNNTSFGNTLSASSRVDITGTAMRQLRLRTAGGPVNNGDTNGQEGDFAYDDLYFYIKTGSGWGRVALDFNF